jgi:carboxypeptidase C (cathepsin A)
MMAYNNTYGIKVISEDAYNQALHSFSAPGGCQEKIKACREAAAKSDPNDAGSDQGVDSLCRMADGICSSTVEGAYLSQGSRSYYDIGHGKNDPFPADYFLGYLNTREVQKALGVPVNFTEASNAVSSSFSSTGDYPRGGFMGDMANLLNAGIKVHLVYGDRDYACNWLGGEAVSLNVRHHLAHGFRSAGYANLEVNGKIKGYTRQYGGFSFTRVLESGHEVPAYQPDAALAIFHRATNDLDIPTGRVNTARQAIGTRGPASTFHIKNLVPVSPPPVCYILDSSSCPDNIWASVLDGTAIVKDNIVVGRGLASPADKAHQQAFA